MSNQQYMLRRNPTPMGADCFDFKNFLEMITKINDMQLEAIRKHINEEIKRREL